MTLISGGTPFDLRHADAGPARSMPERGGGAGLALVRAWSHVLACDRNGSRNRLDLLVAIAR